MDPQKLWKWIQEARAEGVSTSDINARLQEMDDTPFNNVVQVRAAAEHTAGGDVPGGATGATLRSVARGVGGGFLDEGAGLLAGLGAAIVPGGEGFSEARRRVTEEARGREAADRQRAGGVLSTAGEVAGSLVPGATVARGVASALPRVGRLTRAAVSGAAEGGILGAGTGDEGDRLGRAAIGAGAGGVAGGVLGGAVSFARAGRKASKMKPEAGARIGEKARKASGLTGRPSGILDDVAQGKREARRLVEPLEQLGREEIPAEIGETVVRNPILRQEAERVAPQVMKRASEEGVQAARFTFDELDTIARSIRNDASAFKKAAGGDLPVNVKPVNVKKAEAAIGELDDVMGKHLDDFPEFRARWAKLKAQGEALTEGRKLWNKTADDVERAFRELPDDPEVREAFREGLATEFISKVENLTRPTSSLRTIVNSPQTRGKLRVMMGEDGLQRFTRAAENEQAVRDLAHDYEAVVRFIRRYVPGGTVVGGGVEGGRRAISGILDE